MKQVKGGESCGRSAITLLMVAMIAGLVGVWMASPQEPAYACMCEAITSREHLDEMFEEANMVLMGTLIGRPRYSVKGLYEDR